MLKHAALTVLLSAALCGCNNASQSVTDGGWTPFTPAEPPAPGGAQQIETRPVAAGDGAAVKTGDLVHFRFIRTVTWADGSLHAGAAQDAWIWTGSVPDEGGGIWGDYGSAELRLALVSRRVGERFVLDIPVKYQEIKTPRYGIARPQARRSGALEYMGPASSAIPLVLAGGQFAWSGRAWSEIEIIAACPARLSVRTGTMTQRGFIANMFGSNFAAERSGTLRWSAIDADCPAPAGAVRFMLGPVYYTESIAPPGMLYYWQKTYESARPKASHPAEYAYVSIGGKPNP